jgi:hypothetical protein
MLASSTPSQMSPSEAKSKPPPRRPPHHFLNKAAPSPTFDHHLQIAPLKLTPHFSFPFLILFAYGGIKLRAVPFV